MIYVPSNTVKAVAKCAESKRRKPSKDMYKRIALGYVHVKEHCIEASDGYIHVGVCVDGTASEALFDADELAKIKAGRVCVIYNGVVEVRDTKPTETPETIDGAPVLQTIRGEFLDTSVYPDTDMFYNLKDDDEGARDVKVNLALIERVLNVARTIGEHVVMSKCVGDNTPIRFEILESGANMRGLVMPTRK